MWRLSVVCLLFPSIALAGDPTGPNADVLKIAYSYEDGGGYKWQGSGVPEELTFAGEQILPRGEGTFCCGYTLAVVFKAAKERGLLEGKSPEDIRTLHKLWYGNTDDSKETLMQHALVEQGLGHAVEHERAKPGDFVQFWRTDGSGHRVVSLAWVVDAGMVNGFKYRSSQKSTDGIGDRRENFSDVGGKVDRKRFYIARLATPNPTSKPSSDNQASP